MIRYITEKIDIVQEIFFLYFHRPKQTTKYVFK